MCRLKNKIILVIVALSSFQSSAQTTYKEVESTSYTLYQNKDWTALAAFGEKAQENGFDYFYLNLRLGIAYFNLRNYKTSKIYLEKANKSNSYNEATKEYLFWNNYHLLKEKEAKNWYTQLDDTTQQRIDYQPEKIINSVYIGLGQKFSNDKNVAGNVNYFNVILHHHLTGRIDLKQGYTFTNQNIVWGDFTQHQYYLNPSFLINKTLKFNVATHGAQYKSNLDFRINSSFQTPPPRQMPFPGSTFTETNKKSSYDIKGTYKENGVLIQPRITKEWNHFIVSPYFSSYTVFQEPNYKEQISDTTTTTEKVGPTIINQTTEGNDVVNTPNNSSSNQYSYGATIYFKYKSISLGADIKYISYSENNAFFLSPFLKIKMSKKVHLSAYYFSKKAYTISMFEGSQLINSYDDIKKFSLTAQYYVSKKTNLYFTYQHENIKDGLSTLEYQFNSIYIGLKLKF
jgi:hypothetical protein